MKTLKELNKPFQMENELSETRLKLIALDRRLRHLYKMNPKNCIEGVGIQIQKWGIQMQIKGILIRMKNSNPNVIK
jgi:hypothetical protein